MFPMMERSKKERFRSIRQSSVREPNQRSTIRLNMLSNDDSIYDEVQPKEKPAVQSLQTNNDSTATACPPEQTPIHIEHHHRWFIFLVAGFTILTISFIVTGTVCLVFLNKIGYILLAIGLFIIISTGIAYIVSKLKTRRKHRRDLNNGECENPTFKGDVFQREIDDFPFDPLLHRAITHLIYHGPNDCPKCSISRKEEEAFYSQKNQEECWNEEIHSDCGSLDSLPFNKSKFLPNSTSNKDHFYAKYKSEEPSLTIASTGEVIHNDIFVTSYQPYQSTSDKMSQAVIFKNDNANNSNQSNMASPNKGLDNNDMLLRKKRSSTLSHDSMISTKNRYRKRHQEFRNSQKSRLTSLNSN